MEGSFWIASNFIIVIFSFRPCMSICFRIYVFFIAWCWSLLNEARYFCRLQMKSDFPKRGMYWMGKKKNFRGKNYFIPLLQKGSLWLDLFRTKDQLISEHFCLFWRQIVILLWLWLNFWGWKWNCEGSSRSEKSYYCRFWKYKLNFLLPWSMCLRTSGACKFANN